MRGVDSNSTFFIRYGQGHEILKPNNLEVFGSQKNKGPKQGN